MIRAATKDDLDLICNWGFKFMGEFTGFAVNFSKINKEDFSKEFLRFFEGDGEIYVYEDRGNVCGYVTLGSSSEDYFTKEKNGYIYDIFVAKQYRHEGIARSLIDFALKRMKELGFREVRLNVFAANISARQLYENLGFKDYSTLMSIKI